MLTTATTTPGTSPRSVAVLRNAERAVAPCCGRDGAAEMTATKRSGKSQSRRFIAPDPRLGSRLRQRPYTELGRMVVEQERSHTPGNTQGGAGRRGRNRACARLPGALLPHRPRAPMSPETVRSGRRSVRPPDPGPGQRRCAYRPRRRAARRRRVRRRVRRADEGGRRPARRRPVHTLFNTHWHPEQTGSNERLGKAGKTIIAHENTRLWLTTDVTWPWNGQRFTRAAEGRAAEQDVLHDRARSTSRHSLRPHPRRGAHRRRSLRVLPAAERARGRRRDLGPGLAGRRLGDRRLDRRHRRRPAAAADAGQRGDADRARRAGRCSA